MVILDTNVISELTRLNPEPRVLSWLDRLYRDQVFVTAISKAEIIYGLECMSAGKRRFELEEIYKKLFQTRFLGRVLPFDEDCAHFFGRHAASAQKRGLRIGTRDLQIAAIAAFNGFAIATGNAADFDHDGLDVINPWTE